MGGAVLIFSCATPLHAVTIQTAVLSEQRAPNTPNGCVFDFFFPPLLSDSGHYVFRCQLLFGSGGVGVANDSGVWGGLGTNLFYVGRELNQPPGVPTGAQYGDFYYCRPAVNANGVVAFNFEMQNDPFIVINPTRNTAAWLGSPGGLTLTAWESTAAPGLPGGANYGDIHNGLVSSTSLVLNNRNQIAFQGLVTGGGVGAADDYCIWAGSLSNLTLVAREGTQAPTLPVGATFGSFGALCINDAGQVAFSADLNIGDGGVTSANNSSVWFGAFTNLQVLARESQIAAGAGSAVFGSFEQYLVGPASTALLNATLKNAVGGVGSTNDTGVWLGAPGALQLLVREGSPVPGLPSALLDAIWGSDISPNGVVGINGMMRENGTSVFATNKYALWVGRSNSLSIAARSGQAVPGAPGVYLQGFNYFSVNDLGQVAFLAVLSDGTAGIFATDLSGVARLIARIGGSVEVSPGDFRVITSNNLQEPIVFHSDRRTGAAFNARGELIYKLAFTDNTRALMLADVAELPRLGIFAGATSVSLQWKTNVVPFTLQASSEVGAAAVWQAVTNVPVAVNGTNTVTLPRSPNVRYFRLAL